VLAITIALHLRISPWADCGSFGNVWRDSCCTSLFRHVGSATASYNHTKRILIKKHTTEIHKSRFKTTKTRGRLFYQYHSKSVHKVLPHTVSCTQRFVVGILYLEAIMQMPNLLIQANVPCQHCHMLRLSSKTEFFSGQLCMTYRYSLAVIHNT